MEGCEMMAVVVVAACLSVCLWLLSSQEGGLLIRGEITQGGRLQL